MKNFRLMVAYCYIQTNLCKNVLVTGIQFEDGSGYRFNYCIGSEWKFIDLHGKI